jgi:hypothetical protein
MFRSCSPKYSCRYEKHVKLERHIEERVGNDVPKKTILKEMAAKIE